MPPLEKSLKFTKAGDVNAEVIFFEIDRNDFPDAAQDEDGITHVLVLDEQERNAIKKGGGVALLLHCVGDNATPPLPPFLSRNVLVHIHPPPRIKFFVIQSIIYIFPSSRLLLPS